MIFSGCEIKMTTTDGVSEETTASAVTTTISEQDAELAPYPVTINDTVIESSPHKVISLSPSLTEIIFEMGYGDRLIGKGSYCDYPSDVEKLSDAGRPSAPDFKVISALKPDILLTATAIPLKDRYKLEEMGIKTVYIPYPASVDEFRRIYSAMGLIFEGAFDGEAKGAEAFVSIENALSNTPDMGNFVYITEGLSVATGDTFESSFLSYFGTDIGADGTNYAYPKEYLIEFQPDFVFLNDSYTIDDLLADEVYSQLTAVVNGNVYKISNTYFERPSGRLTELIDLLKNMG